MITAGYISHFLLQIYIVKSSDFHLKSAQDHEFHICPSRTTFSSLLDVRRLFPFLGPRQMILSLSCSFVVLLINIRNKKMKSRSQPLSSTLNKAGNLPPCHLTILPPFSPHYPHTFPTLPTPRYLLAPIPPPFPTCHVTTFAPLPPPH